MRWIVSGLILLAVVVIVVVRNLPAPVTVASLSELSTELETMAARIARSEANLAAASELDRDFFSFQRRSRWFEHHEVLRELVEAIQRDSASAAEEPRVRATARDALQREIFALEGWIAELADDLLAVRISFADSPPTDLVQAQIEVSELRSGSDALRLGLMEDYDFAPVLGLDMTEAEAILEAQFVERANVAAAELEMALEERADLEDWVTKPGVDTLTLSLRIAATNERVSGLTESLRVLDDVLSERGLDVADHRRLVVTATGDIGTGVLDLRVLGGLFTQWRRSIFATFLSNVGTLAVRLALILGLLLVARRVSRWANEGVTRVVESRHVNMSSITANLVIIGATRLVWVLAAFVALLVLGIDLAPMLAGLGIAGFVIGFALQDTLANFAAGIMIMVYRPFDVGDFVTAGGVTGEVKDLTLVSTVIRTLDNQRIIVPNGKVWGDVINNATAERIRRVDLVFGISYSDDVDTAREILEDVLANEERVLSRPEPMVRVDKLGESSVDLICRPWCKTEDYWDLYWDLTRLVKKRFDAEGISFPFPQRQVHVYYGGSPVESTLDPIAVSRPQVPE